MWKREMNVDEAMLRHPEKTTSPQENFYQKYVARLSKTDLLDEMMRFQEKNSVETNQNRSTITHGRILFRAIEERAETSDLRVLASSYRRHLEQIDIQNLS